MPGEIRSLENRKQIETAWEHGATLEELAAIMGVCSLNSVYTELRRGWDGTFIYQRRKRYSAELAYERSLSARESQWQKAKRTGFRSIENRREIQRAYEFGATAEQLLLVMDVKSLATVYSELKNGYDGTRLPDGRRRYNAELAHERFIETLEHRGRRKGKEAETQP